MNGAMFVFRTYDREKEWLWKELRDGRLRQGWGVPGTALFIAGEEVPKDEWIMKYNRAASEYWGDNENSQFANKRYNILSIMKDINENSLLIIPKMPARDTFVICSPSGTYTFDESRATPGEDFRHIVPIDTSSIRTYPYFSSAESRIVKAKFRAYQSAVNNVYSDEMRKAVSRLAETEREATHTSLGQIYSQLENTALCKLKEDIVKLPPEDLEQIIRDMFESAGYSVERTHDYDSSGGDADFVITRELPIISDFMDDLSTKIFVQVKKKSGKDYSDVDGVRQLIKITETEENALRILITTADGLSDECTNLAKANDISVIAGLDTIRMIMKKYNA